MKALFDSQELWELIFNGLEEPTSEVEATYTAEEKKALREQRRKDSKARFLLRQVYLRESCQSNDEQGSMRILATIYKGVERVKQIRLQTLRGDLEPLK